MQLDPRRTLREVAALQDRHGAAARAAGVALTDDGYPSYIARCFTAAGRPATASAWYLRSALRRRAMGDLARAALALAPTRLRALAARVRARVRPVRHGERTRPAAPGDDLGWLDGA